MLGEQTRWGAGSRTEESRALGEQNCEKLKKGNSEGMVDHLAHRRVGGGHPSRPDPSFSEVNGLDRSPQSKPAKKQTHHRSIRKKTDVVYLVPNPCSHRWTHCRGPSAWHELMAVRTQLSACAMDHEAGGVPRKGARWKGSRSSTTGEMAKKWWGS
jgi:hypothetical protein